MHAINAILKLWIADPGPFWAALAIFLFFTLFSGLLARLFFRILRLFMARTETGTFQSLVQSFTKPIKVFIFLIGIYLASDQLTLPPHVQLYFSRGLAVGFILSAAYGAFHLEGVLAAVFRKLNDKMNLQTGELLQQFLMRIIRCVVAVLAAAMIAETFGINAGGVVAGLGLAGLAVAMAAQSTLANIFAGIALIMDKPFEVGDRIQVDTLDGLVEAINFRSTKIRLLTQELVSIPNSVVAGGHIINCTRRDQRKVDLRMELGLGANPDALKLFMKELESDLKACPDIDETSVLVRISEYTIAGPVLEIAFLTRTADWFEFTEIRQEAIFLFMETLKRHPLDMAQPMLRATAVKSR